MSEPMWGRWRKCSQTAVRMMSWSYRAGGSQTPPTSSSNFKSPSGHQQLSLCWSSTDALTPNRHFTRSDFLSENMSQLIAFLFFSFSFSFQFIGRKVNTEKSFRNKILFALASWLRMFTAKLECRFICSCTVWRKDQLDQYGLSFLSTQMKR